MRSAKGTVLETMVLLIVGATVAFAGNAWRSRHSIEWTRDYFKKNQIIAPSKAHPDTESTPDSVGLRALVPAVNSPVDAKSQTISATAAAAAPEKHLEHDFQPIRLNDVKAAFVDPRREQGLIVFVDARADEPFEAGHIPGAVQCDHYQLDKYIADVMDKTRIADQVIVYCNGGQCEDSIFMCQNLLERGLAYEAVFLYEGGWKEWEKSGMPIAEGKEE